MTGSGLALALGWSMSVCAYYFSSLVTEDPDRHSTAVFFCLAELLFEAVGVGLLGFTVSRWFRFEIVSYGLLALGWLAGFLFSFVAQTVGIGSIGTGIAYSLCIAAGVAAALWVSNRVPDRGIFATVAVGWFIAYFVVSLVTSSLYPGVVDTVWD